MARVMNTVSAYRSLIQEDDYEIKLIGVTKLFANVSLHWTDIANDITTIESLLEDEQFPDRPLVAMLLAKLYFYLNHYEQSLSYALKAGEYFDVRQNRDEITEILVNKCVEKYIANCKTKSTASEEHGHYKQIVDYVVNSHLATGDYKLAMGIALDTRDTKLFELVISIAEFNDLIESLLPHLLNLDIEFRKLILGKVTNKVPLAKMNPTQYINLLHVLQVKGDYEAVSKIIYDCVKNNELEIAFTLALEVSQMHGFNKKVLANIPTEPQYSADRRNLANIIEGNFAAEVHNAFLKEQAHTDAHYLAMLKKIQHKNSIAHGSAVLGLSMLQSFTQDDSFLQIKENLEWAAKSSHWNKFSSIASLGLIFKNNRHKDVFKRFLPESNSADVVNHYPNGGALYGLGLLFTGTANQEIIDYIIGITTNPTHNQNEVVMHGACLGLGLTAFASGNEVLAERLKDVLNLGSSVMGQASALALGLTFAGTNNEAILADLIGIAQDTEHEKIIRSICMSIGLVCFQCPSEEFLANLEANPTIKLAIPFYMACAYFKTSNPSIVRKLLALTNDISNEVKRAAIIALGFVMYQDSELVNIVKMLLYSYNPNVRYGCIMAMTLGCKEPKQIIDLIWPSFTDSVDYVRQAAFVSVAILLQISSEPKVAEFRSVIEEVIAKPHGEIIGKMGAILSVGILDIGGRNMTISLTTRSGMPKIEAIAGMLVFTQFWNWFPYLNFIGLTLTPSAFIGVTSQLKIPTSFQLKSNAKPSTFDYPPKIVKEEKKKDDKKDNAKELSTTTKTKVRALKKKESDMDIEAPTSIIKKPSLISTIKQVEVEQPQKKEEKQVEKKQEQSFAILNNPTRIAEKQKKVISFIEGRYTPILPHRKIGISFLKDSTPGVLDDYLNEKKKDEKLPNIPEEKKDDDLIPPEDFEYDETARILPQ